MAVLSLLRRARQAGLAVKAEGGRLVIRGPRQAAGLAEQLGKRKDEVLSALERRLDLLCADDEDVWPIEAVPIFADMLRGHMAEDPQSSHREAQPPRCCYVCGESTQWRLRHLGTPWICVRCYPPSSTRNIEWWPSAPEGWE